MDKFKVLSINLIFILIVEIPFLLPIVLSERLLTAVKNSSSNNNFYDSYLNRFSLNLFKYNLGAIPLKGTVQYDKDCFEVSSHLIYSPKANSSCLQNEFEFNVKLDFGKYSNRLDSYGEILNPKTIVLGDSMAMGWGVSNNDIFTAELNRNNLKVLNLSVSSYGTAREFLFLKKWATNNPNKYKEVDTIIIQYCDNDLNENKQFLSDKYSFNNPSEIKLRKYVRALDFKNKHHLHFNENIKIKTYPLIIANFYKRLYALSFSKISSIFRKEKNINFISYEHPETFKKIIINFTNLLKNKRVIVFIANSHGENNIIRYNEFEKIFSKEFNSDLASIEIISPKDTSLIEGTDSYFILDDHINAKGHKNLGKALLKRIKN